DDSKTNWGISTWRVGTGLDDFPSSTPDAVSQARKGRWKRRRVPASRCKSHKDRSVTFRTNELYAEFALDPRGMSPSLLGETAASRSAESGKYCAGRL